MEPRQSSVERPVHGGYPTPTADALPLGQRVVAIEFFEEVIGRQLAEDDERPIAAPVEIGIWPHDEGGTVIDIYGPESERVRRFVLVAQKAK